MTTTTRNIHDDGTTLEFPAGINANEINASAAPEREWESAEETTLKSIILKKMHGAIKTLSADESTLIDALFFSNDGDGMSDLEYAGILGISENDLLAWKEKIFTRLRGLIEG